MPDLTIKGAHQFWYDYGDPILYRVISFMESVESWTYDNTIEIEKAIKKLANALEDADKFELKQEENYINIGANLHMGRLLRILQAIDSIEPGSASKVLMYSEENNHKNETIALFLQRNIAFERLRLLTRVFSPERLTMLSRTLEGADSE